MKYKFIWFDLGQTLVEAPRSRVYKKVLKKLGINLDEAKIHKAYHLADKLFMRTYPHILGTPKENYLPWYIGNLNYLLNIQVDILQVYQLLEEEWKLQGHNWEIIQGIPELLDNLKQKGIKIGLISNWDSSCRKVLKANGLLNLLDPVIISSEVGIEKPSKKIFSLAFEKGNTTAAESLYVGDNYYDDVEGSRTVGMDCLLINPYEKEGIEEIEYNNIISSATEVINFITD